VQIGATYGLSDSSSGKVELSSAVTFNSDDTKLTTFDASSSTTIFVTSSAWQQETLGYVDLIVTANRIACY